MNEWEFFIFLEGGCGRVLVRIDQVGRGWACYGGDAEFKQGLDAPAGGGDEPE